MKQPFWHIFKWVLAIHVALVLIVGVGSLVRRLLRPRDDVLLPVEFVVDTTPQAEAVSELIRSLPEPETESEPELEPEAIPEPDSTPVKREIRISRDRVTRVTGQSEPKPRRPTLSPEEIARLLEQGARRGDHTSVPDEVQRCLIRIRDVLHAVWEEPSAAAAGGREAVLSIALGAGGDIKGYAIDASSGSAALDASVKAAAARVDRITGLTPAFVERYPRVTIAFSVHD